MTLESIKALLIEVDQTKAFKWLNCFGSNLKQNEFNELSTFISSYCVYGG